jgi:hypothetical protein
MYATVNVLLVSITYLPSDNLTPALEGRNFFLPKNGDTGTKDMSIPVMDGRSIIK